MPRGAGPATAGGRRRLLGLSSGRAQSVVPEPQWSVTVPVTVVVSGHAAAHRAAAYCRADGREPTIAEPTAGTDRWNRLPPCYPPPHRPWPRPSCADGDAGLSRNWRNQLAQTWAERPALAATQLETRIEGCTVIISGESPTAAVVASRRGRRPKTPAQSPSRMAQCTGHRPLPGAARRISLVDRPGHCMATAGNGRRSMPRTRTNLPIRAYWRPG